MSDLPAAQPPSFTPVPCRARRDGWTPERQARFLHNLAENGTVVAAARAVGMTARSAHLLRAGAGEDSDFARAWDAAVERSCDDALALLTGRAIEGVLVPVIRRGRQVAEYRRFDDRLAVAVLRAYAARKAVRRGF